MQSADHVFKAIVERAFMLGIPVSNLKLQKIGYYCQGYHSAVYGEFCFDSPLEAWDHGPVVRSQYFSYNHFGDSEINSYAAGFFATLSDSRKSVVDYVLKKFGSMPAWNLRNLTHKESPWLDSFVAGKKMIIGNEIVNSYFRDKVRQEMNDEFIELLSRMEDDDVVCVPKTINSEDEFLAWLHS